MKNEPFPDSIEILKLRLDLYKKQRNKSDFETIWCEQDINKIKSHILSLVN